MRLTARSRRSCIAASGDLSSHSGHVRTLPAIAQVQPRLGLRLDRPAWGKPQPQLTDHPALATAAGTAYTIQAYWELCRRCLYDREFAD